MKTFSKKINEKFSIWPVGLTLLFLGIAQMSGYAQVKPKTAIRNKTPRIK